MELVCVDINPTILDTGRRGAKEKGINFEGIVQDINEIFLEKESFDIIVAYAAMHHFIELDHITKEIGKALKNDGIFITVDIPTRNGYLMWEETLEVVNDIFKILPPKFKLDHAHSATPTYVEEITNMDYSLNSFECIRSEDILPNLRKNLTEAAYVPALSIGRRFFDGIFGPNYDLGEPLDRSIFDLIMNLDEYYIQSGLLKPETFFGAYRKK
jgi:SAM-dependent methyltransferase